jgi:hypothetical protein
LLRPVLAANETPSVPGRGGSSERRPRCLIAGVTFTNPAETPSMRPIVPATRSSLASQSQVSSTSPDDVAAFGTELSAYPARRHCAAASTERNCGESTCGQRRDQQHGRRGAPNPPPSECRHDQQQNEPHDLAHGRPLCAESSESREDDQAAGYETQSHFCPRPRCSPAAGCREPDERNNPES